MRELLPVSSFTSNSAWPSANCFRWPWQMMCFSTGQTNCHNNRGRKIKQELSTNLMSTTTRLNAAMCWKSCSTQVQPPRTPQQQTPPKTPHQKELPRTPLHQTIHTNRMRSPSTPGSAVRQPMKKARIGFTPTTQLQSESVQEQERYIYYIHCAWNIQD